MQVELSRLYPVYAFDTACFYTKEEADLDRKLQELRHTLLEKQQDEIDAAEKNSLTTAIGEMKTALKNLIDQNKGITRRVRADAEKNKNVVQVFESSLVRELHMQCDEINYAMIIVKVYYFGVAESIIKNGFDFKGHHYVFFSASAGQIRTKKFVAIREDLWKDSVNTLTCGLSVEDINSQGGVNVNKYLAYLALCNSATEVWKEFNIERSIVVEDFETVVTGMVDFIDEHDYSIHRQLGEVPITHTDGCGMILPSVSVKNFMIRAPWIKGLLSPFPFDKFIREANARDPSRNHALITDIYGVEHDVLDEKIQIIFTKSQFKMYKYYQNWEEYKKYFKAYHCTAGKCNIEPTLIRRSSINYQMLQTLTSITDEEEVELCAKTNVVLNNISCDRETMLRVLGIRKDSRVLDPTQKCLKLYPALLRDEYFKSQLREKKTSIEHGARAGKLFVDGKYTFLIPDLYAACQFWFEGIETPDGALRCGEVYTREYPDKEKLDVLRSPHLFKEHAVRTNVYSEKTGLRKWFATNGIYTSSYDMISKVLQFDNDGDRAFVVAEPVLVKVAERECSDVVPLYYPMAKAPAHEINADAMYAGMVAAWTGGNIGIISNTISKIWATDEPDAEAVKVLCMENNFVIDYAKTLYKPVRPNEWNEKLRGIESGKLPAFFRLAKDKTEKQTLERGNGVVDRLYDKIHSYRFRWSDKGIEPFQYKMLMFNPERPYGEREKEIVEEFRKAAKNLKFVRNTAFTDEDNHNLWEIKKLAKHMERFGRRQDVCDILVRGLFCECKTPHKAAFWLCYNDIVLDNLIANLQDSRKADELDFDSDDAELTWKACTVCHGRFMGRGEPNNLDNICPACKSFCSSASTRRCVDCGAELPPRIGRGRLPVRCASCNTVFRRAYNKNRQREYRRRVS